MCCLSDLYADPIAAKMVQGLQTPKQPRGARAALLTGKVSTVYGISNNSMSIKRTDSFPQMHDETVDCVT
jgi:hypothetical protein